MTGYSKQYRENRLRVLAGNPTCHYCGRPADTVDHLVEKDAGGGDEMDNLVPACKRCNSRKGQQYVTAKKRAATKSREGGVSTSSTRRRSEVFSDSPPDPAAFVLSVSPKNGTRRAGTGAESLGTGPTAHDLPRLETALYGGDSWGPLVSAWAEKFLGISLMPWQERILEGMLEVDDEARLRRRTSLVSVARQSGKTVALKALVGWWLTEAPRLRGGPQTVVTTAHRLDLAVELHTELAPVLVEYFGARAKQSYGRNEVRLPDGSKWFVTAANGSAGHGRSPDLVVADEVWNVSEEAIDQGLIPAQRARRNPLLAMFSTAGTDASSLMLRWRNEGLRAIGDGGSGPLYFAEWSPPAGVDLTDLATVAPWANPAIGHTMDLESIITDSKSPNRNAFLRSSLNLWVSSEKSWLDPGVWPALETDEEAGPISVLAVEIAPDDGRYYGLVGRPLPDGRVLLEVAFQVNDAAHAWAEVRRLLPGGATLAVTPPLEIHVPPEMRARSTTVGYGELVKWTSIVRSMIQEGRIVHRGDVSLADHMARAVAAKTTAGLVLSTARSAGAIELARLAVWVAALASKPRHSARPAIASSRPR